MALARRLARLCLLCRPRRTLSAAIIPQNPLNWNKNKGKVWVLFEKTSGIPKEVPRVFPGIPALGTGPLQGRALDPGKLSGSGPDLGKLRKSPPASGKTLVPGKPSGTGKTGPSCSASKRRWGKEDAFTVNTGEGEESRGKAGVKVSKYYEK